MICYHTIRLQLAEATNLQDRSLVAQLHETLRCVSLFDAEECLKVNYEFIQFSSILFHSFLVQLKD